MSESPPAHAIAIVGLAGRFPGSRDLDDFWRIVRDGVEVLDDLDDADLQLARVPVELSSSPDFVRKCTSLNEPESFDAAFFGISPREAQSIDPQQRVFLECAWEALEHAGHAGKVAGAAVGVYAGCGMNTYLLTQLLADRALLTAVGPYQLMIGGDKDFLCTRVSYEFDLRGPSVSIQTACSTSLVAVHSACRALHRGECDMALAGGVSIPFPQRTGYLYQKGMIFSPDGHCRPFDADAGGTRAGAGAGIVVLKRLADALADRDAIYGVIRGTAINNDGAAKAGYTAPGVDGQTEVIVTAMELADVDPRSISYVETHGTATPLGDPIEFAALTAAYRAYSDDIGFCHLGSLKANLGHLDAAAGVAGLIKTTLALHHRQIPPLANFRVPNPQLDIETSPFRASAALSEWPTGATPRRAGVSSFGIGGTNAHVIVEEAPSIDRTRSTREAHLLLLSARSQSALDKATLNLAAHLRAHPEQALHDVEWTLQIGRERFAHRRALVAANSEEAASLLERPQPPLVITDRYDGVPPPMAFLFSGQGSQHSGMGSDLYRTQSVYREAMDRCASILRPQLGLDIRDLLYREDGVSINETRLAQPALFATCYAVASLWMHLGLKPAAMLGHSIGEYVAAHLAGVMSLEDALTLVALRGGLMQKMPAGRMVAVHLAETELRSRLIEGVEIAAVNAPALCTVSGSPEPMRLMLSRLQADGIECRELAVSHAFHSAMMEPALVPFREAVRCVTLAAPVIPYVSNLTGEWITAAQATSADYYAAHMRAAVRFRDGIDRLVENPSMHLLEVGPGTVLTSLARMTLGAGQELRAGASLPHALNKRSAVATMADAAGRLWVAGVELDWNAMHSDALPRRTALPTYPFERQRYGAQPVSNGSSSWAGAGPHSAAFPRDPSSGFVPQLAGSPVTWGGNETARQVSAIWGAVLGSPPSGPAGNFFDLGGHSLAAVQVLAQVRQAMGVEVTTADLIENPTVEGFAVVIDRLLGARSRQPAELQTAASDSRSRSVVQMKPAAATGGIPAFALPGHNGDIFCYRHLSHVLDVPGALFALQPPGVDGQAAPIRDLTELGEFYYQQIKALSPSEPCVVIGFCAGAAVALPLARRLQADGLLRGVALVGGLHPNSYTRLGRVRMTIRWLRNRLRHHWRELRTVGWRGAHQYLLQRLRGANSPPPPARALTTALAHDETRRRVEEATVHALATYRRGASITAPMGVFVPRELWGLYTDAEVTSSWREAGTNVRCYTCDIDDNGADMLLPPFVDVVAASYRQFASTLTEK